MVENFLDFSDKHLKIKFEGRIDNRSELLNLFNLNDNISDLALLKKAYITWGRNLSEYLIGDFGIIIFDPAFFSIFLIRDFTGVIPLFIKFQKGKYLYADSDMNNLIDGDSKLRKSKIIEYLKWPSDFRTYSSDTIFEDIFAIKPGTCLSINLRNYNIQETFHWKIDFSKFNSLYSADDFSFAFKNALEKSVKSRLSVNGNTGAHLSGGLDSSSISCIARKYLILQNKELYSVHIKLNSRDTDEYVFAETVLRKGGIKNKIVFDQDSYEELPANLPIPDPLAIPSDAYILEQIKFFKANKVDIVLTGHEGDTTVDSGMTYPLRFLSFRYFRTFLSLMEKYYSYKNYNSFIPGWDSLSNRKRVKILGGSLLKKEILNRKNFFSKIEIGILALFYGIIKPSEIIKSKRLRFFINPRKTKKPSEFSKKFNIKEQESPYIPQNLTKFQQKHFLRILSAGIIEVNEVYYHLYKKFGINVSHPFQDKELIELSLFVPENLKFYEGIGRGSLREAMKGILPDEVRKRTTKVEFTNGIIKYLLALDPPINEQIKSCDELKEILNFEEIDRRFEKLKNGQFQTWGERNLDHRYLQRAYLLAKWFQKMNKE